MLRGRKSLSQEEENGFNDMDQAIFSTYFNHDGLYCLLQPLMDTDVPRQCGVTGSSGIRKPESQVCLCPSILSSQIYNGVWGRGREGDRFQFR